MNEQDFKNTCYDETEKFVKSLYDLEDSGDFYIIVGVKLVNKHSGNEYTFESIATKDVLDESKN